VAAVALLLLRLLLLRLLRRPLRMLRPLVHMLRSRLLLLPMLRTRRLQLQMLHARRLQLRMLHARRLQLQIPHRRRRLVLVLRTLLQRTLHTRRHPPPQPPLLIHLRTMWTGSWQRKTSSTAWVCRGKKRRRSRFASGA
jgi:hypothetical protein